MEELGGVSATDVKKALEKIREHGGGPPGMDSFLREVGFPYIEKTSSHVIRVYETSILCELQSRRHSVRSKVSVRCPIPLGRCRWQEHRNSSAILRKRGLGISAR